MPLLLPRLDLCLTQLALEEHSLYIPRSLANLYIPKVVIFFKGVTFSKAHHFGALHVSFRGISLDLLSW